MRFLFSNRPKHGCRLTSRTWPVRGDCGLASAEHTKKRKENEEMLHIAMSASVWILNFVLFYYKDCAVRPAQWCTEVSVEEIVHVPSWSRRSDLEQQRLPFEHPHSSGSQERSFSFLYLVVPYVTPSFAIFSLHMNAEMTNIIYCKNLTARG